MCSQAADKAYHPYCLSRGSYSSVMAGNSGWVAGRNDKSSERIRGGGTVEKAEQRQEREKI